MVLECVVVLDEIIVGIGVAGLIRFGVIVSYIVVVGVVVRFVVFVGVIVVGVVVRILQYVKARGFIQRQIFF